MLKRIIYYMKYMNKQIPKVIHKIIIVDSMKTPEFDEDMTNAINSFKIHNPDYGAIPHRWII